MIPLSLGDRLRVFREKNPSLGSKTVPISLKISKGNLSADSNNLVFRAASAFREMVQAHNGKSFPSIKIFLDKDFLAIGPISAKLERPIKGKDFNSRLI